MLEINYSHASDIIIIIIDIIIVTIIPFIQKMFASSPVWIFVIPTGYVSLSYKTTMPQTQNPIMTTRSFTPVIH